MEGETKSRKNGRRFHNLTPVLPFLPNCRNVSRVGLKTCICRQLSYSNHDFDYRIHRVRIRGAG